MATSQEMFDVVDDQDRVIGRASRDEVHTRSLKHRAVHIFVFNGRGELFVQKRSATKDTFPGCYDSSASGHLGSGEDYDPCAHRELREELGLDVPHEDLRKHFKIAAGKETGWEFVWAYSVQGDYRPVINQDEIETGDFWPLERIAATIAEHPERCAPGFVRIYREFCRRALWPTR
jgi:isopentenyl-diphosphate delta-isomerase